YDRPPSPRRHETPPRHSPPRYSDRLARYSPRKGSSPRRNRHRSPNDEEIHRGPLSRRIMDLPLPVGLEKPHTMDIYDGSTDPVDHIENIEA
ncbi:hypothetical protein A2U01_0079673, partial [Trifolium medium]|nr:hypothetical protein [Trifolium medium]